MATIAELPGIYAYMKRLIVEERKTYRDISTELRRSYPMIQRGLSERSIARFCERYNIHATSRIPDQALDTVVRSSVAKVGPSYGRRMMTGLLASQGLRVCQLRVGQSLQRVDPGHHHRRLTRTHQLTNPVSYRSDYFGEKLHIDQNEKLVMYGVTHVCAIDGHSGKIVAFTTMPIKNNIVIYKSVYMKVVQDYGLWNQLRVDKGREWYLMLFVQEKLSRYRNDLSKPAFLQTASKQNHMIERLWVEVNTRVNYPVKKVLIEMENAGDINMADDLHKYCVSWFSIKVLTVGVTLFIQSWNSHPIPGRRRGGMNSHIPNDVMRTDNRIVKLDLRNLPCASQAVSMYHQEGGRISDETNFGADPLQGDDAKTLIRAQAFGERYPSYDVIFHELNGWTPFSWACHNSYTNVLEVLIHHGANVNQQNDNGWGHTPLMTACWKGHINTAKLLVENGAIVGLVNKAGQSPLYVATYYKETAAVRFLLKHGADVNLSTQDEFAFTPLMIACENGDAETARVLLNHGAIVDCQNKKGNSSLHISSQRGDVEVVNVLLEYGAQVNLPTDDKWGQTPLMYACCGGHVKIAKLLVENGAIVDLVNKAGQSPLYLSSNYGETTAVRFLLEHGADVNLTTQDTFAFTSLNIVCENGHAETARVLLDHGAVVDYQNKKGDSSLHISSRGGHIEIVKVLLEYKAQVNLPCGNKLGNTALIEAYQNRHTTSEIARLLLDHGAAVDCQNKDGWTPLALACKLGYSEVVQILLDYGANVNHQNDVDKWGFTPLMGACWVGNINTAKLLVENGAIVDLVNKAGQSPLYVATYFKETATVRFLLEHGANATVNFPTQDESATTVLAVACENDDAEIVRLLLEYGVVVDNQNKKGDSSLHISCKRNQAGIAKVLLEYGVEMNLPNADGWMPLALACDMGNSEVVKILLDYGANVNQQNDDEWGPTPLMIACWKGHINTAKLLVENGAIVDRVNKTGQSPLYVATYYKETAAVRFLLEHGADVNLSTQDEFTFTPLMIACENGDAETTRVLLNHGAIVDYQNKKGDSSLHISSRRNRVEVAKMLLEHRAQVNLPTKDGRSPLFQACDTGHFKIVEVLLQYSADVNQYSDDEWGVTPLIGACWKGHTMAAQLLVENGAIIDLVNKAGQSPLYIASSYGETTAVRFLLEHGADVNLSTQDESAFNALVIACYQGNTETVRVLLEHGKPNIDYQSPKDGWSALMYAVDEGHIDIVKMLIDHGAAVTLRSKTGLTALDIAKAQDIRDLLLQQFAKEATLDTQQDPEIQDMNVELHQKGTMTHSRELTMEQEQEVKSVRKQVQEMFVRMFFKEKVKKKEYLKKQQQENEELSNSNNSQPNIPERPKVRIFGRIMRKRQRIIIEGTAPAAE